MTEAGETFDFGGVSIKKELTGGMPYFNEMVGALQRFTNSEDLLRFFKETSITLKEVDVLLNRLRRGVKGDDSLQKLFECVQGARALLAAPPGPGRTKEDGLEVRDGGGSHGNFAADTPHPERQPGQPGWE